jgi:DtxR family transcriptional regulator, Mn-dependent transcriptional regulator
MTSVTRPVEEALQALYVLTVEAGEDGIALDHVIWGQLEPGTALELERHGLATVLGDRVRLTPAGQERARLVVRRHRLAERLLTDVLDFQLGSDEDIACELEHIVSPELTRSICTLLGHPTECPRGRPIPPGACCEAHEREVETAIMPLTDLRSGERGVVVFMGGAPHRHRGRHAAHPSGAARHRLGRLTALGIFPGEEIRVRQTKPALVIESGQTVIALDAEVASGIRVRKVREHHGG